MKILIAWMLSFAAAIAVARAWQEPVPSVPQLTDAQQLTFQKSLSAFYLSAANLATAEGAILQAQQRLETAREALKSACPGEIIDVKEKPAECRLKPVVPAPGTNGDLKSAPTPIHQPGDVLPLEAKESVSPAQSAAPVQQPKNQ